MFIAGHNFLEFGPCACGIHWPTIRNATSEDLGRKGIAHYGPLTRPELDQIEQRRSAEDALIAAAMEDLAK